jgi:transcriptional regulator with XRE-family HTH domain
MKEKASKQTLTDKKLAARQALRDELFAKVDAGELGLVEAAKMLRKVAGKTQGEYAALIGIAPRVLIDFERGAGNPTLSSLARIFRPFGLELTVRRARPRGDQIERFNILVGDTVVAQAKTRREAMDLARTQATRTGASVFVRDGKRGGSIVASIRAPR